MGKTAQKQRQTQKQTQKRRARRPVVEEIEPRILYSADFAPGLVDAAALAPAAEQRTVDVSGEFTHNTQDTQSRRHEIVFVDPATPDYQKLIDDIRANAGTERNVDVVLLDPNKDGIKQISQALATRSDISAVHLLSHGSDGAVQLGSSTLNFDSLLKNAKQIKGWSNALTADADLLIYGCDVAQSADGKALVDALSRLMGADVAASEDMTGAAAQGGDWTLEYQDGQIATALAVSAAEQQSYQGVLQSASIGSETRANQTTTNAQFLEPGASKQVAVAQDGSFVVTWVSQNQDTATSTGVYARRYAADGTALSAEILVNQTTVSNQREPAVAIDPNGNFVVTWTSQNQVSGTSGRDTYARQFSAAGSALGNEFLVNTTTAGDTDGPAIAMAANGRFVISWSDLGGLDGSAAGAYLRVYDASGVAQTGEVQVNTTTAGNQYVDSVATDASGNFVVVGTGDNVDGSGRAIFGQRFAADGTRLGAQFTVNTSTTGDQIFGSVAMNASGAFVVSWTDSNSNASDVFAQRFNADGSKAGAQFQVNSTTANAQQYSTAGIDGNGNLVFAWASTGQDSGATVGVYQREFNADGSAHSVERLVNTTIANDQANPSMAMNALGQYVVVWQGNGPGDADGIFFQRYSSALIVDTTNDTADGTTTSISNLIANKGADGRISLREALAAANNTGNTGGPDRIYFNIAGAGPHTITLSYDGPDAGTAVDPLMITDAVIIDGTSEPDFAGTPVIELNGTSAGAGWVSGLTLAGGSSGSTIRGLAINRFSGDGILIQSSNNVITANFLGTDSTGTLARGNSMGLVLDTGSTGNRVGGTTTADRNIISGNTIDGIEVMGATTQNNLVQGNYIGLDVTGTADLGNVGNGVAIFSAAANNTIGGTAAGAGNVISGNNGYGIGISAGGATANIVQGNRIGTNAAGTAGVGNSLEGIYISGGAGNTVVGGTAAGAGNTIAYNTLDGVALKADASTGNSIRGNAIFSNGGLGIDLGDNGLTANDTGDGDTGPNSLQNSPVLSGDDIVGGNITIGGKLNSTASTLFTIDFYASTSVDPSGYGEGQRYLGSTTATTNAGGNVVFSVTLAAAVSAGEFITATATSPTGNTSEFSKAIGTDVLIVDTTSDASNGTVTSIAALLANRGADGLISLREALSATNGSANGAAPDQILFNIAASGVQTITVASALPQINDAVIIDGTSEPGFAGTPIIEINGNGLAANGFTLNGAGSSGSEIHGLVINRFAGTAIRLIGSSDNVIAGNYLGTNTAGTAALGNQVGVYIGGSATASDNNRIGGTTAADRNVISGNSVDGIQINGGTGGASGNLVQGNYIGLDAAGTLDLGNTAQGIAVWGTNTGTQIGGTAAGAGNVISGNNGMGIGISTAGTTGTVVQGNYIGTNAAGTAAIANGSRGIQIASGSSNNTIGGTAAGARNVISGNTSHGVEITDAGTNGNLVQGNYIGTNAAGAAIVANGVDGIHIGQGASNNTIGGAAAAARNVISGNADDGIEITDSGTTGNSVQGNYIGLNAAGTTDLGNAGDGVIITNAANSNAIGAAGAGNVISGNDGDGIRIYGSAASVVQGNIIGLNASGSATVGNTGDGVRLTNAATNNTIGGALAGQGNIISGNNKGVEVQGVGTTGNIVQGNYIGTDLAGMIDRGNTSYGVSITAGAANNTLGGTTAAERNVISGNDGQGVRIDSAGTTGNVISGNYIGTNAAGTAGIANSSGGVLINNSAANNTIGGLAAGAGNLIAYNTTYGINVSSAASTGNAILGNAIHSNTALGIDLRGDGITANDGAKTAAQPNLLMDFPVIQFAGLGGTTLTVSGYVGTAPNDTDFAGARIEFFRSPDAAGANGEADLYLGALTADASGNFSGTLIVAGLALGDRITATATDTSNNTSELGLNVTVASAAPTAVNDAYSVNEDGTLAVDWWDTDWTRRSQITFTGNNFGGATNLTDFPVLIALNSGNVNYALTQNQGQDLRFVDANGAPLAYQIESWNESGTSYVWVKVPQVDVGTADSIWMYYGNAAAAAGQNPTAVWANGFSAVYHLSDSGTSIDDSSASNFDGTAMNGLGTGTGQVAGSRSFDGTDDYIDLGANRALVNSAPGVTLSTWINTSSVTGGAVIIGASGNATLNSRVTLERNGDELRFVARSDDATVTDVSTTAASNALANGVWRYVTATVDVAGDTVAIYVNGVAQATTGTINLPGTQMPGTSSQAAALGANEDGGPGRVQGSLDEVRWSTVARSAAWVRAEYLSMTGAFATVGAAQTAGVTQGVLGNDSDPNGDSLTAVLVSGPSNAASFTLNADGTFTYTPTANFAGTDTFTYRANDGTSNSNLATVTLTVNPVNDAPVNTVPGAQSTNEDTALVFSSGNSNRISIADIDAASGAMQVTLTAANGTLTLAGLAGLSFTTGDGTADATMTFTGTVANINTALNGLAFTPTANYTGVASVQIVTSDQGNTGSGGTLTDSDTVNITVNAVNDAPTATITPANYAATEQTTLTLHGTGLSIADVDAGSAVVTATVSVTSGTLSASAGSTGATVGGSGTATVTLTGTIVQINNLLAGVSSGTLSYLNSSDTPVASATLTLSVNDGGNTGSGGAQSGSDTATINIAAVNDAPTATIVPVSYSATEQTTLTLHGTGMSLADPDAGSSSITATVSVTAGTLSAGAGTNGVVVSGSGTATVTLTGARTEINNLLAGTNGGTLTYVNASDAPAASATLTLSVNDGGNTGSGGALTGSDTATINISAVNDAPVNSVPAAQSTNEDTARVFSSGNGNQISIADPDAASSTMQVTLTVTNGVVNLAGTTGLTITSGADGSATVTFTGTAANINTALNGLAYTPTTNFNGAASLQIVTSDLGNTGSGGALTDTDNVAITVNVVDDPIGAVSDANAAANSVAENAAVGTLVGITAVATDPDTTDTVTYSLDVSAGGRFAISSTTGVVTVAGALDREAAASHSITVRATSSGGGFSTQAFTVNLTDVDEFDVGAITDANAAANSVAENAAVGTVVGITASASDADATTNTITYTLDNDAGGRFAINGGSGVVTVAGALDREAAASHGIVVRATSADGSFSTQGFTVNLTDVDEFDVGAISDANAAANSVAENAAVGTVVGITASASDADATTNTITYTLDNDAGGRFAINGGSGVVTVAGALDREAAASHGIVVRATSADGSFSTQGFTVNLTDVDEFDVGAITDANAAANSVAENAAVGTVVGITASASDADATTNTITYTLDNDAGGRFAINGGSGVVTVAGALDREAAASHGIVVRATSADGSFSTQGFTVNLTDVDEFDVGAISDVNAAANSVAENAAVGTVVGITASASDADATTNTITYTLDNDAGGRFAINGGSGVVTVAGALDREAAASHGIVVRATSADGSFSTQGFTIGLTDVDEFDVGAISDANAAANSVAENAGIGSAVGITAVATDADATTNSIAYSLDDDAGGRFAINGGSGVVTVAGALDYETATSHNVIVRATSADGSFSTQAFTVAVTDINDSGVGAVSDTNAAANSVAENAAAGSAVGITAFASDPGDTVSYTLDDNAGGRFAINASSGVVTVVGGLDRESAASHSIVVRATSTDTSFNTQSFTVLVADVDEFDVGAISDTDAAANSVAENAAIGTLVGITASASDADATTNAITYTLDNDAGGRFAINGSSGAVTVAGALDREAAASHGIVVRATSADGSFSTQAFTVALSDVDEFDVGAISDTDAAANSVAENAAIGTLVGITASASDADATTNAITYTLDNDAGGRFAINGSSGAVTVAGALDREAAASHGIVVRATSADGSFSTQAFTVALSDVDEFDVGAISDTDAAANSVAEDASVGTLVGITASASDADATSNTITYTLDNDAGGRFAINGSSGVVTVAGALDREAAASHGIVVRATSADGSFSTQGFTVALTDVDEFDVGAISDTDAAANSVAENAAIGTLVGITASASDADATTNAITYTLDNDAGGRFAINGSSGAVTVAGALDREAAASHGIVVRATSADGSFSTQAFTVALSDVDEFDVGAISDTDAAANSVAENAAIGTLVGITASASDADATTNAITYTLDNDAGGRFAINGSSGAVTVAGALDREAAASHGIVVRATSADGSFSTQAFTVALSDVDEFDVGAISDTDAAANSVAEDASVGTLVGITASASDADATSNTITYTLDNDAGGRFAINGSSGVVTVAGALDREAAASHGIVVRATSADGSFSTQGFTVALTDVDEFDVGAISDTDAAANSVAENAAIGTLVGITASASDADATNNSIAYSLDDDDGGRFAINAASGVVTVAGTLDAETLASHTITVRADSADGSFSTQVFTIDVADVDEFDISAVTDADAAANSVAENAAIGTLVGITAEAADADATTNAIAYSLDDNAGGRFAVDVSTGVVTVAGALDRESAASHSITVRATSADGSSSTQAFTVNLTDVDEFDVGAISDADVAANSVAENAALGTLVGVTASAADPDATTNAITYSLDSDAGGRFAINASSGVVTVAAALDAEAATSHNITVRATSADGSSSTQIFSIAVGDVDEFDVGAIGDADGAADSVAENAAPGTVVGITAAAADADATTNAITYSLDANAGGRFVIDGTTGVVTVAGALDAETATSHNITVRATSVDGSTSTQTFTIAVADVDEFDVGAISDTNGATDGLAENAAPGTAVGITAAASDADATTNGITYSLDNDAGGRFAINASSGVVTVASVLDAETATSHGITVRATSADGSFSTQGFTIAVSDVNESAVGAVTDADATPDSVAENATAGTLVGVTAVAVDPDVTLNTVTYSLDLDAGGLFAIDGNSGVVSLAGALDAEAASSHTITVRATSVDGSSSTQSFVIAVADVDEFDVGAISDTDPAAESVAEDAVVGTVVGITASADDADATTNTITYTLDDDAGGLFAIDGTSGVVTVAGALDAETAASHNITVRATSADGSASTAIFSIGVTDVDESPVGPVGDADAAPDAVTEDAAPGTLVGITASAIDADATNNVVTYSLDDDASGRFAIDSGTGVVTLVGALDAEVATAHSITVRATSTDGSFSTRAFSVVVTDVSESDVGPISDSDAAINAVGENSAIGTVVGVTASAVDTDATDSVSYSLTDDAGGLFAIDSVTGVVTVAGALDAELASNYTISVQASSTDGSISAEDFVISVNDLDEFDVGAISDIDLLPDAVDENAVVGTTVGILAYATDDDATASAITYSLDDDAGGRFAIDATTGELTVAGALDRETAALHAVIVRASSADGSSSTQTFNIDVNDVDEFDIGPIADIDAGANSVAENAAIGTLVGITASASDPDATTSTITYTLDDDAGGRFAINGSSGVVTVAGALDREAAVSHGIVVRATSADGSFSTQAFTVGLTDMDEFDVGTITDIDAAANSVAENAAAGTLVGLTASAADGDATNNAITYSLDNDAGGRFAINASSGVVTVAGALDREAAVSHGILVRATSADGSFSTQAFTIGLTDVDEFDVGAVSDTNAVANSVAENAAVGTAVGITAAASDADATTNAITYTLDSDAGGRFAINAGTGVVTVAGALDAETAASHGIVVRATSADGSFSTQAFTIGVTDVNEFGVGTISDSDAGTDSVAENAAAGTLVGITASASDPDATTNAITYTLDNDAGGRFTINGSSGVVTVAGALDREAAASHGIVVRATSVDGSFSTQAFSIAVGDLDEFDVGAISDTDAAAQTVAENAAVGTLVGITASASDADATTNTITYSLDVNAGGRFAVNTATGVVTVAGALDAETAGSHNIVVRATSADGSFSTQAYTVAVTDVDEFDVGVVGDADAAANAVAENAAVGAAVGITATASDADASSNTITYSLDNSAGGRFAIDGVTGVVTVAGALDAEAASAHGIVVRATSADGSFSTQGFTIGVTDVNEFAVGPIADVNAGVNSVAENAVPGTLAGITAAASDADATTNTITYSLDVDAGGRFAINAATGVVTVAGALDAEAAASHNIVVRATSADGSFSTQALTVSVADVNEAPVVNNQAFGGPENSANATVFGTVVFADSDAGDTATYTITAGNLGGAFSIDASGQLLVANSAALDFETIPSFSLTVQVQDSGGLTDTAIVTVNLSGVNEAPAFGSNTLTVTQGGSVVIAPASLFASDVDTPAASLVFTASSVTSGHFELVAAPGTPVAAFTQAQINAGQVRFVHDGSNLAPALDLTVSDGSLSVGPVATSISFGTVPAAVIRPPLPAPVIPMAPAIPAALPDLASVSERVAVAEAATAPVIPAIFSPGRIDPPQAQVTEFQLQPLRTARPMQPTATLNHFTAGPHIDPTLELLAAAPANLQYLSTVPVDWHVRPAFPDAEETPRDRIDVLLEQVQLGGMALSVGVVWWASRISGLLGSLLASAPAWRHIDPLPVVGRDEEEDKKWFDPDDRDAEANELAIDDVFENARAAEAPQKT